MKTMSIARPGEIRGILRLPAKQWPEGQLVRACLTRKPGIVLAQTGDNTQVEFADGRVLRLHPNVLLEAAE